MSRYLGKRGSQEDGDPWGETPDKENSKGRGSKWPVPVRGPWLEQSSEGREKLRLGAPASPPWGHSGGAQGWVPDIRRTELTGTAESPREGAETAGKDDNS